MLVRMLAAALAVVSASPSPAQRITVPVRIVSGDPVPVRVSGLPAGAKVEIGTQRRGPGPLRAVARFRVGSSGTIDLARDAPVGGDYDRRDPAGLFWSMHPVASVDADLPTDALRVAVVRNGRRIAYADVTVLDAAPGIVASPVSGFPGATLHARPKAVRQPVVILLGGSEGGDAGGRSLVRFVTRQGYAALVLPYYAPPWVTDPAFRGLPTAFADIPVDRIAALRDWIATQPALDASRIAVVGVSKGGEFAMLAAAHYSWLRAVVGIVPADVVWEGWGPGVEEGSRSSFSWGGRPLPFVPYTGMAAAIAALERGEPASLTPVHAAGRRDHPAAVGPATIAVDRYPGPMMVVGGGRDATWPSADMVRNIADRRRAAGLRTEALIFPDAGHALSGSGWNPLLAYGPDATAEATAAAQPIVRARVARFLRDALAEGPRR